MSAEIIGNILGTKVVAPEKGKKKNLLNMAKENAKIALEQEITIIKNDEKEKCTC